MYIKDERRSNVVEKFKEISNTVWIRFEAMITEKTSKEKWTYKKYFYDNYNLV